jgi:hypothetical protein
VASTLGSGVVRPTTLPDLLGAMNQQSAQSTNDVVNGLSGFAEVDENATVSGAMTATAQVPPGWGAATWGAFAWA